jgi:hypothetical protein
VLLGQTVTISDVGSFHPMQRHVHGSNAQHRGIEVKAIEQPLMEVPPQLVVAEERSVMLAQVFTASDEEATGADGRIADHVVWFRLDQLDHSRDEVARGAELTVLTGCRDLRQHVLVEIALGITVAHVELVELVDDLGEQCRPRDLETSVAHVARVGRILAVQRLDKREYVLVDDAEHLWAGKMLEPRPA